jgi:iron transport multicopper oxidase
VRPLYFFSHSSNTVLILIPIDAGQRYSFVLKANATISNYWIRTVANGGTAGFDNGINSAILRYVGAPLSDPTTTATTSVNPLVETNLHPLVATPVPGTHAVGAADVALNLAITLDFTTFKFRVNGAVRDLIAYFLIQLDSD